MHVHSGEVPHKGEISNPEAATFSKVKTLAPAAHPEGEPCSRSIRGQPAGRTGEVNQNQVQNLAVNGSTLFSLAAFSAPLQQHLGGVCWSPWQGPEQSPLGNGAVDLQASRAAS